jgi:hypothetical protein
MKFDVADFTDVMFEKKYKNSKDRHGYQERNGFEAEAESKKEELEDEGYSDEKKGTDHIQDFARYMREGDVKKAKVCLDKYLDKKMDDMMDKIKR